MSYDRKRERVKCFSCDASGDVFDVIGWEYGLTDFNDMFNRACEIFGVRIDGAERSSGQYPQGAKSQPPPKDYGAYFSECRNRIKETDYPRRRGLGEDVVARFNLGYDPKYDKGTGGKAWPALIIPTGKGSFVARNTGQDAPKQDRYRKQGGSPIFNKDALYSAAKPVFVVEGEFDALSVMTAGGEAVALGSTANANAFLIQVEGKRPSQPLIIALDNDEDGRRAAEKIEERLKQLNISFYRRNPYGDAKDANEALVADRDAFISEIGKADDIEQEARWAEQEAYYQTSAGARLDEFIDGIKAGANTPPVPTGFKALDDALDGGLYEGLHIVGAISSLGKTTLILQIADQIAAGGRDALIFSLEMAANELISKSISRHTFIISRDSRMAKTARGITDHRRYEHYTDEGIELINNAIAGYAEYARNIYITEGMGDVGASQVRDAVQRHIDITRRVPVVVIDYLQLLAPHSERATDKQNTDKAVLELKRISRDFKLPVVCISSFNRESYKDAVKMQAFKESGAIEYSSDVLIGLQLEGAGDANFDAAEAKRKDPRRVELVILKNRNGLAGEKISFDYYPLFNYYKADPAEQPSMTGRAR
jgi:replicative DNA helicase